MKLEVITSPDPRLRVKSEPVDEVTPELEQFIEDMLETMYVSGGVGLSAVQVGRPLQIIVADISKTRDDPRFFVNPVIAYASGTYLSKEGCLSEPGIQVAVPRAGHIELESFNGLETFSGLMAAVIQHEIDHINGRLLADYTTNTGESK